MGAGRRGGEDRCGSSYTCPKVLGEFSQERLVLPVAQEAVCVHVVVPAIQAEEQSIVWRLNRLVFGHKSDLCRGSPQVQSPISFLASAFIWQQAEPRYCLKESIQLPVVEICGHPLFHTISWTQELPKVKEQGQKGGTKLTGGSRVHIRSTARKEGFQGQSSGAAV